MTFAANFLERLRTASVAELPVLRAEYETYLAGLSADEQKQIIRPVEPTLAKPMDQSVNRLESAAATCLTRTKQYEALSAQ